LGSFKSITKVGFNRLGDIKAVSVNFKRKRQCLLFILQIKAKIGFHLVRICLSVRISKRKQQFSDTLDVREEQHRH